jgi:pilus assembly protein CpaE
MRIGRNTNMNRTRVVVLTADAEFDSSVRSTFAASSAIDLSVVSGRLSEQGDTLELSDATVVVLDFDAGRAEEMAALARLMSRIGNWPPVVAVTQNFDESVARVLLQMRVADFLVKPVEPIDLVRACARVSKGNGGGAEPTEAKIYTFLPAVGGAGVTTLAVQTAMILLNSGGPRLKPSTCLVDLDFQHGSVADYLDLEPRLNLAEIEAAAGSPRPAAARSDALVPCVGSCGHRRPQPACGDAFVRSGRGNALLDLVSTNFEYVIFDMPRTCSRGPTVFCSARTSCSSYERKPPRFPGLASRTQTGGGESRSAWWAKGPKPRA